MHGGVYDMVRVTVRHVRVTVTDIVSNVPEVTATGITTQSKLYHAMRTI